MGAFIWDFLIAPGLLFGCVIIGAIPLSKIESLGILSFTVDYGATSPLKYEQEY